MKCIIIDDEPLAREGIEMMMRDIPFLEHCGSFAGIMEADKYIAEHPVDLIFLDIHIPRISGIEYLRSGTKLPQVIFITAFPQYALQGFELDVTDYLVKPVSFERFYRAVNKALHNFHKAAPAASAHSIEIEDNCIFVRSDKKFVRVSIGNILFVKGMKDYSVICTTEDKIIIALNLRTILPQLPEAYFMRVSKSYIINLARIKYIEEGTVNIAGEHIPIGDGYKESLVAYIKKAGVIKR